VIDVFGRSFLTLSDEYIKDKRLKEYLRQKARAEQVSMSIIQIETLKETTAFKRWLNS
jgi:hypothetical protein